MYDVRLEDLVARFIAGILPREEWTHAAHLTVGLWHVREYGQEGALERLRLGIRSLNERHGTANTDTSGYHETITVAYVRLIEFFIEKRIPDAFASQVRDLLDGPLADRNFLLRFWSPDVLMSPAARRTWTPPDLCPLVLQETATAPFPRPGRH